MPEATIADSSNLRPHIQGVSLNPIKAASNQMMPAMKKTTDAGVCDGRIFTTTILPSVHTIN
jgi:hypothetical protein